nr:site-specific integrase [Aeromicrobium sp. Leaf272]
MRPFSEAELDEIAQSVRARSTHLADVILIAGWTGLRWGELRAVRVSDLEEIPTPVLVVRRSQTEGRPVKVPKSGRARRVPIADRVLPLLRSMAADKGPGDLLITTPRGAQLHVTAFKRATDWTSLGRGRRIHDLRHTAACLWLARGVELATVQAWMGHSSVATTNRYVHFLGSAAERAGLDLLNAPGQSGGKTRKTLP